MARYVDNSDRKQALAAWKDILQFFMENGKRKQMYAVVENAPVIG